MDISYKAEIDQFIKEWDYEKEMNKFILEVAEMAVKLERERIIKLVSELEKEQAYEFPELKSAILKGD